MRYNCVMGKETTPTSLRLTLEAKRLLQLLAQKSGVSMAAIIEIAIREKAKREGIE